MISKFLETFSKKKQQQNFLWLSLGSNQYRDGRVYDLCVFYDWSTLRLTASGFMEKPGIEPGTPGL